MKILNLKIFDTNNKEIQNISFKQKGISYIYGDIQDPDNAKATINSLGKTLLLKFIDYIFGCDEDREIMKKEIINFKLDAIILFNNKKYHVLRTIGDSKSIYVDKNNISLNDYKKKFKINRNLLSKQIILSPKVSEIGNTKQVTHNDIKAILELLDLNEILDPVNEIYSLQNQRKTLVKSRTNLYEMYDGGSKNINEEIFFIDKEIENLEEKLIATKEKVENIEITDLQGEIIEKYQKNNLSLKNLKSILESTRFEKNRLIEFIEDSNKTDISSEHIIAIYEQAQLEVPKMVKKTLIEVEEFHQKVYKERKTFLNHRLKNLNETITNLDIKIKDLSKENDRLGLIISENRIYRESLMIYEENSLELQSAKYKQGKLSQIKNIENKLNSVENGITIAFDRLQEVDNSFDIKIEKFREFIFNITKNIYDDQVLTYFEIIRRERHLTTRPITIDFTLKGDTGEGVNEVKKNLIDYLICNYNHKLSVMIHDSSCYSGIDPRQTVGLLDQLSSIAVHNNKQVIVSINKYQIGNNTKKADEIKEESVLVLSENEKLLKFDF